MTDFVVESLLIYFVETATCAMCRVALALKNCLKVRAAEVALADSYESVRTS